MRYKDDPVNLVYDKMADEQLAKTHRNTSRHFRASEADRCKRQLWYRISQYRPAPNDGWLEHLGVQGDVDHDTARDIMRHYGASLDGLKFVREEDGTLRVEELESHRKSFDVDGTEVTIACRADGMIDIGGLLNELYDGKYEGDGWALLEVKGMDGWSWKYANEAFIRGGMNGVKSYIEEKKRSYVWQMTVTMKLTDKDHAYLLVKDRSMAQHGFHNPETGERIGGGVWKFDPELWQRILRRFATVQRAVESGEAPRPEFADGSKQCSQCPFYYLCHGAANRKARGMEPYVLYPVEGEEDYHNDPEEESDE